MQATTRSRVAVARLPRPGAPREWIRDLHEALGPGPGPLRGGAHVLIKPNFNAAGPPPVSTDLELLKGLIGYCYELGARRVTVGESSRHPPTSARNVMKLLGVFEACREAGAEVAVFGEGRQPWVEVPVDGRFFRRVRIARQVVEADHLVFAGVLKTHRWSRFSMSLKLSVGLLRPRDRLRLHLGGHFQERIVELASALTPDLVLLDGREVFIKGGPSWGRRARADLLIASRDRVAADVTGIRCLQEIAGCNLRHEAWSYRQIKEAVRLGLGAASDAEIEVIELPVRNAEGKGTLTNLVAPVGAVS